MRGGVGEEGTCPFNTRVEDEAAAHEQLAEVLHVYASAAVARKVDAWEGRVGELDGVEARGGGGSNSVCGGLEGGGGGGAARKKNSLKSCNMGG